MVTGYEVQMYNDLRQISLRLGEIAENTKRIADALEATKTTTPEDIENMGEVIAAVKRGFADMEHQIKEEGTR